MLRILLGSLLIAANQSAAAQADWPQFRGPTGQGHAEQAPLTWSESDNVRWRAETPGRGWSSPVIAGGLVWLTTAVETPDTWDAEATAIVKPNPRMGSGPDRVELFALAYSRETGELVRRVRVKTLNAPKPVHALNSYASPTPAIAGGRVYCSFGSDVIAAIDAASGDILFMAGDIPDRPIGWRWQFPNRVRTGSERPIGARCRLRWHAATVRRRSRRGDRRDALEN